MKNAAAVAQSVIRCKAQDMIMQGIADAISNAGDRRYGETPEIIEAARKQGARVGRMLGYVSWPGIFNDERPNA